MYKFMVIFLASLFPASCLGRNLEVLELERTNRWQDVIEGDEGDKEFLIVSTSHGNPGDVRKRASDVRGGNWRFVAEAGNDDKAIEVWFRPSGGDLSEINTKHGSVDGAILSFSRDNFCPGRTAARKLLSASDIYIRNRGRSGLWLVIAASDSGGISSDYDWHFGHKKDDPVWVYLVDEINFRDESARKIRGAILSIELKDCDAKPNTDSIISFFGNAADRIKRAIRE